MKVKATVPGNIYKDLEKNFLIENPLYRFNDYAYRWISLKNWKYTKLFQGLIIMNYSPTFNNIFINSQFKAPFS